MTGTLRASLAGMVSNLSLLLVLNMPGTSAGAAQPAHAGIAGRWQLASLLAFADIASIGEKEGHDLVGEVLTVDAERVSLGGKTCGKSSFRVERVRRNRDLRENAHVRGTTLGLPDPVDVVELSCAYLYMKTADRAVLAWRGAYFDVVRLQRW